MQACLGKAGIWFSNSIIVTGADQTEAELPVSWELHLSFVRGQVCSFSAKWGRHEWPSLVAYGENRGDGCTRGKRGNANITGRSRKPPQLCMKRDPPPASLLRGSSNFHFVGGCKPLRLLLKYPPLSSTYPTLKRFTCLNDPWDNFTITHCFFFAFKICG